MFQELSSSSLKCSNIIPNLQKIVSLPQGLRRKVKHQHKDRKGHHDRKGRKHRKNRRSVHIDPKFFQELDKLINDFQKYCCIGRFQQPR